QAPREGAVTPIVTTTLASVSALRQSEPAKLRRLLRGELDWIVMKALEKDRNRRYETANSLAEDVRRYLADEAVQACPPSAGYRLRKFARRNKRALVMAGVLLSGLLLAVVGLAVSTVLTWRAKNEVEKVLAREQRSAYFQRIALAEREWSSNNFARAEELLKLCPPEFRGWEWHYLKRLRRAPLTPLRHDSAVYGCAISPDGKLIVSLDLGGFLRTWDAASGRETRPAVRAHDKSGSAVLFSSDGRRFVTLDVEKTLKIWD